MRVVATGALLATAFLGASLALAQGRALAREEADFPWGFDVRTAGSVGFTYDDNAMLGRQGQFLSSGGRSGRETGISVPRVGLELEIGRDLDEGDRFSLGSRVELGLAHTVEELAGYDFTAAASYRKTIGPDGMIVPELRFAYRAQEAAWTNRVFQPRIRARYFFDFGLIAELRYRFTAIQFARQENGRPDPKNSYGNIDRLTHTAELDLRLWLHPMVRAQIILDFQAAEYEGALADRLADYVGLLDEDRSDVGIGFTASVLVTPLPELLLTPGVRCEANWSNSVPFNFNACRLLVNGLLRIAEQHSVTVRFEYGRYNFPDEQFDRRYVNTRVDFRRTIAVGYRVEIGDQLVLDVRYRRLDSVSNDCADFDPARDARGLPINSRSFSCFDDNRLEAVFRFSIDL